MKRRWDVQSIFEIGKLLVWIMLLAVTITEALNLMAGIMMVAFPQEVQNEVDFLRDMGSTLSAALFGIGNVVMLFLTHRFFKNVCEVGTPFTHVGAQELKRMAIVYAVANGVALLGCYIIDLGIKIPVPEARMTNYSGLVLAAVLFVGSYILDSGAKLEEKNEQYRNRISQLHKESKEQ